MHNNLDHEAVRWFAVGLAGVVAVFFVSAIFIGMPAPAAHQQAQVFPGTADASPPQITSITTRYRTSQGLINLFIQWATDEWSTTQVEYGIAPCPCPSVIDGDPRLVRGHSVAIPHLAPGISYYFRVRSQDASGNLAVSETFVVDNPQGIAREWTQHITTPPSDTTPPRIESVKVRSVAATFASLRWVTDEPSTSQVEYGTSPCPCAERTVFNNFLVKGHDVTIENLSMGTTYYARVRSEDSAGNSTISETFSFTTLPGSTPPAPPPAPTPSPIPPSPTPTPTPVPPPTSPVPPPPAPLPPPTSGPSVLGTYAWTRIPNSAMNRVYNPAVDDQWNDLGAPRSWEAIQRAWSGGVCANDQLYVWGGGHGDGAHNGLLSVDPKTGAWTRVTEPSPIWTSDLCPGGICENRYGECEYRQCGSNPDGTPVSRHTYNLLVTDGAALYAVGGGSWPGGNAGNPPTSWRFDLQQKQWTALDESGIAKGHGNMVAAGGKLYLSTGGGNRIYDIASGEWTDPPGRAVGFGGLSAMIYSPANDRIYVFGNGQAYYIDRANFGGNWNVVPNAPAIIAEKYLGATYYAPEAKILLWKGGRTLTVFDVRTHEWSQVVPAGGDPGLEQTNGTFGRFSYCGGRVVLVNGVGSDLYYLAPSGSAPPPAPAPLPPPPAPPPPPPAPAPLPPPPPVSTSGEWPVMATPPGGTLAAFDAWADTQCGAPRSAWPVYEVGPGKQYADTTAVSDAIPANGNAVIRIYPRDTDYPALKVKGKKCVDVVGVGTTKPIVNGVNATAAYHDGEPVKAGGLIVRNLHVRNADSGSCIGVPNNQQFLSVEDSIVERCPHHGLITSGAHHFYIRLLRNHFRFAHSHLVYIDRVARSDIFDNVCESPGWGHCIRSIAHWSNVIGNIVSNVGLDGKPVEKWDRPGALSIGMHPLEVYNCSDGVVKGNTAIKWQDNQAGGTILFRGRTDIGYCDVEGKSEDGTVWLPLAVTEPRFQDPALWDRIGADLAANGNQSRYAFNMLYEGNITKTTGPRTDRALSVAANSNYPSVEPRYRTVLQNEFKQFVLGNPGLSCSQLSSLTSDPVYKWLFDNVQPGSEHAVCEKGVLPEYIPLPAPDNWYERQHLTWGAGNQTLACPTLTSCAPGGEVDLRMDDKQRVFRHPQANLQFGFRKVNILINAGGARVGFDNEDDGGDAGSVLDSQFALYEAATEENAVPSAEGVPARAFTANVSFAGSSGWVSIVGLVTAFVLLLLQHGMRREPHRLEDRS